MSYIEKYIKDILSPYLRKCGVCESFVKYTTDTVHTQLSSIIRHWDDFNFRRTILLIGADEGFYYKPAVISDIRSLVVVAIRNSPIETIQSDSCAKAGLTVPVSAGSIRNITSKAIEYFAQQNLLSICAREKESSRPDIYKDIMSEFPITKVALQRLATGSAKVVDYKKVKFNKRKLTEVLNLDLLSTHVPIYNYVVLDGFNAAIDPPLVGILKKIASHNMHALIVDSFKSLTRNPKKLFMIIEYVLSYDCAFVTSNYYLENGHVERRKNLLRPGHTPIEMLMNLLKTDGLEYRHKRALISHIREAMNYMSPDQQQ